mmetsp:Transcript_20153/g.24437  ORF Transcript_20153/g.24437 Transcript_20153/m.24437 type:complete len:336 (-) Transcript_20153:1018-2025(-)|eukprot:CAMPEP_0204837890 /NCGR_PEP_ID=MMETSP1346-20131115/29305_1 /ASSEMBLY_ACC=CAM_ASM_000771 /TAXON_ID=215587 /ORGANISM="Aplanochytrium stocchinoi, Strain GSBS06" /LENGTH=335 /DNA_ID=CAMNT_0051973617 /DNA_START=81 /DNA_END=1088 /DNA_ORIENTATION=-
MEDVGELFQPTLTGWIGLIPQMWRSRKQKEDKDLVDRFYKMKEIRSELRNVERGITEWNRNTKSLATSAKKLSKHVGTDNQTREDSAYQIDLQIEEVSYLDKIRNKIGLIDELISLRSTLKYIKLKGDYAEHKLQALKKKEAHEQFEIMSERYLKLKKEAYKQHDSIMKQIMIVADKYVDQAEKNGSIDIILPQLRAFKLAQFQLFLNCQKLISGPDNEAVEGLEKHWNSFSYKISNKMPGNDNGSFAAMESSNKLALLKEKDKSYRDSDFEPLSDVEEDDFSEDDGDVIEEEIDADIKLSGTGDYESTDDVVAELEQAEADAEGEGDDAEKEEK